MVWLRLLKPVGFDVRMVAGSHDFTVRYNDFIGTRAIIEGNVRLYRQQRLFNQSVPAPNRALLHSICRTLHFVGSHGAGAAALLQPWQP